jgi:hypothetical protein
MNSTDQRNHTWKASLCIAAMALFMTGCSSLQPDAHMAAFSTQLTGSNHVPPVATPATGVAYAALDKNTLLLRWKVSFSGLSGPATAAHFHGPTVIGANASATLAFKLPVKSPVDGRATLTPAQAADLLSGKWYLSIETAAHPHGEIRGQMMLRE